MQIYLDNEEQQPPAVESVETVQALADLLKSSFSDPSRIIVSITCDEQPIPEEQLDQVLAESPSNYNKIEFGTLAIKELAVKALEAARVLLSQTREYQQSVLEHLAKDDIQPAIESLAKCITQWTAAHDSIMKTAQLTAIDMQDLVFEDKKVVDILNGIAQQLGELKDCLTQRDYVLLNDLMQYEISPTFNLWEGVIDTLISHINTSDPAQR